MTRVLVIGSGASGVHFALTLLERGFDVTMLDTGHTRPPAVLPEASFDQLKEELPDPVAYFLGPAGEGVVYPASKPSYYGHPPSKAYVFRLPGRFASRATNMAPLFSFARGGLAEAWTAGSYEFSGDDLRAFPIDPAAMGRGYQEVARRIGIGGERDDLAEFIPFEAAYLPPLPLDPHSALLLARYGDRRARLRRELGFVLGRSRVATLSREYRGRRACDQLGRCLWGCPTDAIYSPAVTLQECLTHARFQYVPGVVASHFEYDDAGRVTRVLGHRIEDDSPCAFSGDLVALAAGALASSKLVLDSIHRRTGRLERLQGLMDNRQVHVPFLTPAMIGTPLERASYQFHHLAFGLARADPAEYVHGQITTLKAAAVHPIVQSLPLDFRGALSAFRSVRAGLGLANVNLHDHRRTGSTLSVRPIPGTDRTELAIEYADDPAEPALIRDALSRVKRALRMLGALVPPGMTRVLPKGASVHYAGTLPMTRHRAPLGCRPDGRSWDFPNLLVADGASFPFLPAKNLTFTLMANAVRVAQDVQP
jgi:choline dehydrogenase-like flavoprotein